MTHADFEALVQRVEKELGDRPSALRLRIALLALTGYVGFFAYFGVVLLIGAAFFIPAVTVAAKNGIVLCLAGSVFLGLGFCAVGRAFWIRLPRPDGRAITPGEAPALFAMLAALRNQLRSAGFHRVLITPYCNASVTQHPRLGVLGWSRNYLQLGLPLLEALSPEQLRAVLAHEFAHLSRQHGRFGAWIYRLRLSWETVFAEFRQPQAEGTVSLRPLVVKFIDWFWPRFNAHAFVFSRANEFEADATAAQLVGAEHIASALLRIDLCDRLLEEKFWPASWQGANTDPAPPSDVFHELRETLDRGIPPAEMSKWLEQSFRFFTSHSDTHPCLTERLRALNALPDGAGPASHAAFSPMPAQSAAEMLLATGLERVRKEVAIEWREKAAPAWRDAHARAQALQARLSSLAIAVPDPTADCDALWDNARAMIDLQGDTAAEPTLRQILALRPDHAAANFCLGRLLLTRGDEGGEAHLENAISIDETVTPAACDLLHVHFRRSGRTDRVREVQTRIDEYQNAVAAMDAERGSVTGADTFVAHGLSLAELAPIVEKLTAEPDLISAHVAQKQLRFFRKQRFFILAVAARRCWHDFGAAEREKALVNRLFSTIRLPGRMLIIAANGSFRAVARKVTQVPGSSVIG